MVILKHQVKDQIPNVGELLDGVSTIEAFCGRIEAVALKLYGDQTDRLMEWKGWVFELFVEYLLVTQPTNRYIGIADYVPGGSFKAPEGVEWSGDYGIDGVGRSTVNKLPAIVQAKYRSNSDYRLRYSDDHLANAVSSAFLCGLLEGVKASDAKANILYVTTAQGIHQLVMANAFLNRVRCLGRPELGLLCDGQVLFWEDFAASITDSQTKLNPIASKVLREHQEEAVEAVLQALDEGVEKCQVILPTGTGKTLIMSRVLDQALFG